MRKKCGHVPVSADPKKRQGKQKSEKRRHRPAQQPASTAHTISKKKHYIRTYIQIHVYAFAEFRPFNQGKRIHPNPSARSHLLAGHCLPIEVRHDALRVRRVLNPPPSLSAPDRIEPRFDKGGIVGMERMEKILVQESEKKKREKEREKEKGHTTRVVAPPTYFAVLSSSVQLRVSTNTRLRILYLSLDSARSNTTSGERERNTKKGEKTHARSSVVIAELLHAVSSSALRSSEGMMWCCAAERPERQYSVWYASACLQNGPRVSKPGGTPESKPRKKHERCA